MARSGFDPLPDGVSLATRLVHGARRPERNAGAVVPPIYQTSTFHYPAEFSESAVEGSVYVYTRDSNPTQEVAAELIRLAEGAERARVFASGMGAISTSVLALLSQGEELVAPENLYGRTGKLFQDVLPRLGIRVRTVSEAEASHPAQCVTPSTRVAYIETPTNPLLGVHDIESWANAAHKVGALLLVDSTFATPVNQTPLSRGADLVLHSGTKYLGGHADLIAGAAAGRREVVDRIDRLAPILGPVLDPFAAFLLTRGLRTLQVRVSRQNESGARIAETLASHRNVERVYYPGRASEREETIARRQMLGRGGMLSLTVRGGSAGARRFLRGLRLFHVASSLGGVESLATLPTETSHVYLPTRERTRLGIKEGLVRLSVGIESADDLIDDLYRALDSR